MINIGDKIVELRKRRNWSQADLAKAINASRDIIGKYERNENNPSIEMAIKIAGAFDVPLDFLFGESKFSAYDKNTIRRIEDIEKLDEETKNHLFFLIDNIIQNYKAKKAFGK